MTNSKFRDILMVTLRLTLLMAVLTSASAVGFLYVEKVHTGQNPASFSFYINLVLFGTPGLTAFAWGMFIKDTRHRTEDPNRFSRFQMRVYKSKHMPDLIQLLDQLGYKKIIQKKDNETITINAIRFRPTNIENYREKKFPTIHTIIIEAKKRENEWTTTAVVKPAGKFVIADFKNTIHDSVEELTAALGFEDITYTKNHEKKIRF